jgi:hypothetical protein
MRECIVAVETGRSQASKILAKKSRPPIGGGEPRVTRTRSDYNKFLTRTKSGEPRRTKAIALLPIGRGGTLAPWFSVALRFSSMLINLNAIYRRAVTRLPITLHPTLNVSKFLAPSPRPGTGIGARQ